MYCMNPTLVLYFNPTRVLNFQRPNSSWSYKLDKFLLSFTAEINGISPFHSVVSKSQAFMLLSVMYSTDSKKRKFPPGGVGKLSPSISYIGGNSSTLKIYFSLCVDVFC